MGCFYNCHTSVILQFPYLHSWTFSSDLMIHQDSWRMDYCLYIKYSNHGHRYWVCTTVIWKSFIWSAAKLLLGCKWCPQLSVIFQVQCCLCSQIKSCIGRLKDLSFSSVSFFMNLREVPRQASYQSAAEILQLHFKTPGCPLPKTFLQQGKITVHCNNGQQSAGQVQKPNYMWVEIITHKAKERLFVQMEIKFFEEEWGENVQLFSFVLCAAVQVNREVSKDSTLTIATGTNPMGQREKVTQGG